RVLPGQPRFRINRCRSLPQFEMNLRSTIVRIYRRDAQRLACFDLLPFLDKRISEVLIDGEVLSMRNNNGIVALRINHSKHRTAKYRLDGSSVGGPDIDPGIVYRDIPTVSVPTKTLRNDSLCHRPRQSPPIPCKISR